MSTQELAEQAATYALAIMERDTEITRLKLLLRYQDDRDGHMGTHSEVCYSFGLNHYECALRRIAELERELLRHTRGY